MSRTTATFCVKCERDFVTFGSRIVGVCPGCQEERHNVIRETVNESEDRVRRFLTAYEGDGDDR